tara:strand:- start:971 stop:1162 length:192 start_codon:yes stop_codon:yes gene_type:complete
MVIIVKGKIVEFTEESLNSTMFKQFKKAYEDASLEGKEQFTFEGNDVLVSYAKYVIQYVESKN